MIAKTIEAEAKRLATIGYPLLSRLILDSLKKGDNRATSLTMLRACGILERGRQWSEMQKLNRLASALAKEKQ